MMKFSPPKVWLAPMSGATDAPFRRQAVRFGAPAVVSEMVAGEALIAGRPDMTRRIRRHDGEGEWIVQLAGRRPEDMKSSAALLAQAGVDVIDINMGCPSKQVTGGQSGSALMRDLELAFRIIEATLDGAAGRPVTLKMRLGWCEASLNAPELAQRAEALGVQMITVHGRTRCRFYSGAADWARVGDTVSAVKLPVLVNGDICDPCSAQEALRRSGAHGVMIGRAAMGRPWLVGAIAAALGGRAFKKPSVEEEIESLIAQIRDSVDLYGERIGVRTARKHISALIDVLDIDRQPQDRRMLRGRLCRIEDPTTLQSALEGLVEQRGALAA